MSGSGLTDEIPVLDSAVIDELRESVGGDDAFIADLAATFVQEGNDYFSAMEAAAAAGDTAAIVRPAHTLKSSSAALGAMRLAQVAREIEMAGRAGDSVGLTSRVTEARAVWDATLAAMTTAGLTQ